MHIKRFEIQNIRSIAQAAWEPSVAVEDLAGWHVLLGNNGSGKTSMLQAFALGLVGFSELWTTYFHWYRFQRRGATGFQVRGAITPQTEWDKDSRGRSASKRPFKLNVYGRADEGGTSFNAQAEGEFDDAAWESKGRGWFSAGYGPFRRFGERVKNGEAPEKVRRANRHRTLFDPSASLTGAIEWLQELHHRKLEGDPAGIVLDHVQTLLNEARLRPDDGDAVSFLPHGTRLHAVSSKGVEFRDGNGVQVSIYDLSDGYRSILSLVLDLIRELTAEYGDQAIFDEADPSTVVAPGVVLIDEVDAHLHPTWQQRIGFWFTRLFPNIQFIVGTHSPLVCQAAISGSIFRLADPGSDEQPGFIEGPARDRLLYGNILDAYGTHAFGNVGRSPLGRKKLDRLADLSRKARSKGLEAHERDEFHRLQTIFGSDGVQA